MNYNYDIVKYPRTPHLQGSRLQAGDEDLSQIPFSEILGKNIVFSGGGFFRIFPYPIIKNWAKKSPYLMTYFHPREFDPNTPKVESLPLMRKIKTYINVEGNFNKWKKLMNDFSFVNIEEADKQINWDNARTIQL
jgi:hypothetical protein